MFCEVCRIKMKTLRTETKVEYPLYKIRYFRCEKCFASATSSEEKRDFIPFDKMKNAKQALLLLSEQEKQELLEKI